MTRRPPGEVRDAIIAVMRDQPGREASTATILVKVQERLDGQVAASSVRSYLQLNNDTFQRVAPGRYRMKA